MEIGLSIADFTWPGGPPTLGRDLARYARAADEAGVRYLAVMDHYFQIPNVGPPEHEMLEAYTTLGFLAGHTERVRLLALVTGVAYHHPGALVKQVTTLDVLSGGRGMLGIGAAWNEEEARGLGLPFPPTAERFERLEETLQIAHQMWAGDESPYQGRHYRLERPLNSPQALSRPHPPIMVGGQGERKTLRLVAQYADACNLFPTPELPRKLDVLRQHCADVGRDESEIEKTAMFMGDVGERGEHVDEVLDRLHELAGEGIQTAIMPAEGIARVQVLGERVVPAAAAF